MNLQGLTDLKRAAYEAKNMRLFWALDLVIAEMTKRTDHYCHRAVRDYLTAMEIKNDPRRDT